MTEELAFPNTQILSKTVTDTSEKKEVKVVMIGENVPEPMIEIARTRLRKYGLKDVSLVVQQGFGQEATDIDELKSMLMQDLYKNSEEVLRVQSIQIDSLKKTVDRYKSSSRMTSELIPEMKVLFPSVLEASCSKTYIVSTDSMKQDTVMLVYLKSKKRINEKEQLKIREWLGARVDAKNIKLLIE